MTSFYFKNISHLLLIKYAEVVCVYGCAQHVCGVKGQLSRVDFLLLRISFKWSASAFTY